MSSGPKNVTSTTNTEPPAFLRAPLTMAVNAATSDFLGRPYNQPGLGGLSGGLAQGGGSAIGNLARRAIQAQQGGGGDVPTDLPTSSLQDDIFKSLDLQFNRAADLTRGRLDTEFAGAGRNLGASLPARSQELQSLAGSIYSPSNLLQFDPLNMLINRLSGVIPGAGGSTQSVQPVFRTGLF